jgi:hypothetical protein
MGIGKIGNIHQGKIFAKRKITTWQPCENAC